MFSFLSSIYEYFFPEEYDIEGKEKYVAEQLLEIESELEKNDYMKEYENKQEIPRSAECFQRTGLVTFMKEAYILIDGMFYFDLSNCSINVQLNDKVLYLGYRDSNESVVVVRILENQGAHWGDVEDAIDEKCFEIIEHVLVSQVDYREGRNVIMKDNNLKFSLDDVEGTFIPIKGDWLELICNVQYDDEKPSEISESKVLQVISFKPVRCKVKNAVITYMDGDSGICDSNIYFSRLEHPNSAELKVGLKVLIEVIESSHETCIWRVNKLLAIESSNVTTPNISLPEEETSLKEEKERNIKFTYPIKFENMTFNKNATLAFEITNNSDQVYVLNKWMIPSKKRDSQVEIKPFLSRPTQLYPNQTLKFTATCHPKFSGFSKECLVIFFKGFQLKRFIEINVMSENLLTNNTTNSPYFNQVSQKNKTEMMKKIRQTERRSIVPGVRLTKPPAFIPVRLGIYPIPEKIWWAVLGDSGQRSCNEQDDIFERIENSIPCLSSPLNINNYIDKWHALLHLEEVQMNINIRTYDMPRAFLIRCQEYLALEIKGLSEKRPSLIKGDKVIVKDIWDSEAPQYEGFIHNIKGEMILIKFIPYFHEKYSGGDMSIEFYFNRSIFRRGHQAINLAFSNLGPNILFPSRLMLRPAQIDPQKLESIRWFNTQLNFRQKAAVTNVLMGESRPLPYVIFGPPGTGKTVTVVETILQILSIIPDSRILIATPSNSAANLLTERLIQYRKDFSDSVVRLIANYLVDSDNIPEAIRPFCATLDITREDTAKSTYFVKSNGIQENCRTSFVGRHRVTVGTCCCIGALAQMGLPKGHFTHVIVDEAGQATEPEIMIPLTFVDKEFGQIILAGDPMQLGPVVTSRYAKEFGMDETYLSRILETFPYQKDYNSFEDGYNSKLVTKLSDNYRSLQEVLNLPSEMFYDASLVEKMERNQPWVTAIIDRVTEIFDVTDSISGGIYVHGVRGCNARCKDSPSWYNTHEASMVAFTLCQLYKKGMTADEIGIITPYIAQVKYLRLLFDGMGLPHPKVGTVEEFQGQEKPLIIISTVRSTESLVKNDIKHSLGFVSSPKRLNVALTRAQVAVILFCNPHLLCRDLLWRKVIARAVEENKYMGCDLPDALDVKNKD